MKRKIFVLVFPVLFSVNMLDGGLEKQEFFADFSVDRGISRKIRLLTVI